MTGPTLLASALIMGFLGSSHCVLMCSGVVAMTSTAMPVGRVSLLPKRLRYLVACNAGRLVSYSIAGAVAGLIGASLATFASVLRAELVLGLAAGTMIVAVGLWVAGLAPALGWIERLGQPLWRRLAPLARRLVPARRPEQAFAFGLLWGWMPCGLVYAALAVAVSTGSALRGAATMAAFGLGTLPMLLTMGSAAALVAGLARLRWVRGTAGIAMVALGIVQIAQLGARWSGMDSGATLAACPNHPHG